MKKLLIMISILLCNQMIVIGEEISKDLVYKYTNEWELKNGKKINEDLIYQYIVAWYKQDFDKIKLIVHKITINECLDYMLCLFSHEELITSDEARMYFPYLIYPLYERYTKEIPKEVYSKKFISLLNDPNISEDAFNFFAVSADRWINKQDFEQFINILFSVLSNNLISDSLKVSATNGIEKIIFSNFRDMAIQVTKNYNQNNGQNRDWTKIPHEELIKLIIQSDNKDLYIKIKSIVGKHLELLHQNLKSKILSKSFYASINRSIVSYNYIIGKEELIKQFHLYMKSESNLPIIVRMNIARTLFNRLNAKEIIPDVELLIAEWEKQYVEAKNKDTFYFQKDDIRYLKEYIKSNKGE